MVHDVNPAKFRQTVWRTDGTFTNQPAVFSSKASSSALHDGEHTAWDFPSTLRVPISERARCLPHMKHDMVAAPNEVVAANGEPDTLDL